MAWNEKKWEKKFESFALLLKKQERQEEKTEQFCKICGKSKIQLFFDHDGIPVCTGCRDNRVSHLKDAAGILYLAYGNFSRMFEVGFRYPNLFFLETEIDNIYELDSMRGDYSGLIVNTGRAGYDFTLGIAKNIPPAFLEEVFVFSFSRMYLGEKMEEWKNKDDILRVPLPFFWTDVYKDPKKLMEAIQKSVTNREKFPAGESYGGEKKKFDKRISDDLDQSELSYHEFKEDILEENIPDEEELNEEEAYEGKTYEKEQLRQEWYTKIHHERQRYEKAIMICYLYDNGREEQADILKEKLINNP